MSKPDDDQALSDWMTKKPEAPKAVAWKCWIGWHAWNQPPPPNFFGDTRKCKCCGEVEKLVEDVWNAGDWVPVRYLGESEK